MRKPIVIVPLCFLIFSCVPKNQTVEIPSIPMIRNEQFDAAVEIPSPLRTGEVSTVHVKISREGIPVDLLSEGRILHVIVASEDQKDLLHVLGPVPTGTGDYVIQHTFARSGRYRIFTEVENMRAAISHDEFSDLIAFAEVETQGQSFPGNLSASEENVFEAGQYVIGLDPLKVFAREKVSLTLSAMDPLGASIPFTRMTDPANYVLIGPSFSYFRHGHFSSTNDAHTIALSTIFPTSGRYLLWTEMLLEREEEIDTPSASYVIHVIEPSM